MKLRMKLSVCASMVVAMRTMSGDIRKGFHHHLVSIGCLKAYHPQCVGKDEAFLEAGEQWACSWHSCFICHKRSSLQCFCCPNSVCRECIRYADFVQLKMTKGFCSNCLKLVLLIEEDADVDSDGCAVDFKDTETYEFLFKDYWEIVKEQEKLSLKDVHEADALSKKGESYISRSELDQIFEEEGHFTLDDDGMSFKFSGNIPVPNDKGSKGSIKRCRSKKREFRDWCSVELVEFLASLGEDTKEPLKQWDCHQIIENYIQENNLLQPNKKKKTVLCDKKLLSLFRKKTVKLNKIYNLLEDHFASNEDLDDESRSGSEEEPDLIVRKRFRQTTSEKLQKKKTEKQSEQPKSCYAAMIDQNIKLVYLRRSLVKEFLGTPETLERKVVGCFVRVKRNLKDLDYSPSKVYQLGLVSAVKKIPEVYMVGERTTDIVLRVSNIWKDVYISLLSDDDFEEEECEDLRELVKKGLFVRPTVAALEEKIRSIHEDIMRHWIKREIAILQREIDRANEKGWNREKFEYIERRAILQTDAERARLLKQIPKVIPDVQEFVDNPVSELNFRREGTKTAACEKAVEADAEGRKTASCEKDVETNAGGNRVAVSEEITKDEDTSCACALQRNRVAVSEEITKDEEVDKHKSTNMKSTCEDVVVIETDEDDEPLIISNHPEAIVIDDDKDEGLVQAKASETPDMLGEASKAICEHRHNKVWYYVDPSGKEQGPFTMLTLQYWRGEGYFDDDFRVWRAGESPADAILLTEALLLTDIEN